MQRALKHLQQYIREALSETDAESSMLGVTNGLLMKMLLRLEAALDSVQAEAPSGSEQLAILVRGIDTTLRLTIQVHRFSQLRHRLREARQTIGKLSKTCAALHCQEAFDGASAHPTPGYRLA